MKAIQTPIKCDTIIYDAPMDYLLLVLDEICVYRDHVKPVELDTLLGPDLTAQLMASLAPMKHADGFFKLEGDFLVGEVDQSAKLDLLRKAVMLAGQLSEVQFDLANLLDGNSAPRTQLDGERIALLMAHIDPLVGNYDAITDVTVDALNPLIKDWALKFKCPNTPEKAAQQGPLMPGIEFICPHCGNNEV